MGARRVLLGVGVLLATAGTAWGTGAVGAIVGADGTINGCYEQQTGMLRVVAEGSGCRANELAL
jgi:hypothetical protein